MPGDNITRVGSNQSSEWFTPAYIINAVRYVLNGIDCDPCSNAEANKVVRATKFYTADDNGLSPESRWFGTVFVNPPSKCGDDHPVCGLQRCMCKLPLRFMTEMFEQHYDGLVTDGIYLGYSLGQVKYIEEQHFHSNDVRIVMLRKRIKFVQPDGVAGGHPTQDNFLLLLSSSLETRTRFDEIFGPLGQVWQTL